MHGGEKQPGRMGNYVALYDHIVGNDKRLRLETLIVIHFLGHRVDSDLIP